MSKKYSISKFYRSRSQYHQNDLIEGEGWQLEIYLHALGLMKKYKFKSVVDVGTGPGDKFVTYFGDYKTLGLDLHVNVEKLKKKFPDKMWEISDLSLDPKLTTDVIICADVIEHLIDPDQLLNYIKKITFKYLVISTPVRNLIYRPWNKGYYGPPRNDAHIREWNYKEFVDYISKHFKIIDHRVTNLGQATQMIICES